MSNYGISEQEVNLIKAQAARRAELRREFMKQSTNPFKHAAEAGYVFDPAMQRFLSLKVTQFSRFKPNTSNSLWGIGLILPMAIYAYMLRDERAGREEKIRNGELKYKDRLFKFM